VLERERRGRAADADDTNGYSYAADDPANPASGTRHFCHLGRIASHVREVGFLFFGGQCSRSPGNCLAESVHRVTDDAVRSLLLAAHLPGLSGQMGSLALVCGNSWWTFPQDVRATSRISQSERIVDSPSPYEDPEIERPAGPNTRERMVPALPIARAVPLTALPAVATALRPIWPAVP